MENERITGAHHKISPTAKLTAYWRSKTDIPYAEEIARAIKADKAAKEFTTTDEPSFMDLFAVACMEARYKSINNLIRRNGFGRVLEIACGLTTRGLEIAGEGGIYVGTDLPDISLETFPLIKAIALQKGILDSHLFLYPVNALNEEELKHAASFFQGKDFSVCNEGLLMYLNREEKMTVAQNIRVLLKKNGGSWITTDIAYHEILMKAARSVLTTDEQMKRVTEARLKKVTAITGRNLLNNYFIDEQEAVEFYKSTGFAVSESPMYDGNYPLSVLSSLSGAAQKKLIEILSKAKVWLLTPR